MKTIPLSDLKRLRVDFRAGDCDRNTRRFHADGLNVPVAVLGGGLAAV